MAKHWLFGALLCLGCEVEEAAGPRATRGESRTPLTEEVREQLRSRIDTSTLVLSPGVDVTTAAPFDETAALAALAQATGTTYSAVTEGAVWTATDGAHEAKYDLSTGQLLITSPDGYDAQLVPLTNGEFEEKSHDLLTAFASDLPGALTVKHLGGAVNDEDGTLIERMGTKVFAFRTLGGLVVGGQRAVASYLNDGRVHAVRAHWPQLDLDRSLLSSNLTEAEVVERALDLLVEHGVNPNRPDPIPIESFFEARQDQQGWVVVLRAAALVVSYSLDDQPGRRERHEFDL